MLRIKEIATAAGTLACAVGIGFVMQNTDSADRIYNEMPDKIQNDAQVLKQDAVLDVEGITLTSAELETPVSLPKTEIKIITAAAPSSTLEAPQPPQAVPEAVCEISANARAIAAAMVNLTLEAACLPNERVTVHHNGMMFSEITSADGSLDLTIPALTKDALFVLAFSNGDGAVAQTVVEEVDDFDRAVLQWRGEAGFAVHALEFGADYGDEGHVWSGAARDLTAAVTGVGGFLTKNGNVEIADPLMAEVYSIPKALKAEGGSVVLSVEAEVTLQNCGAEIEAQALQITADSEMKTQNLSLAVPDCEAVGNFLVLNNLLQDLTVAAN